MVENKEKILSDCRPDWVFWCCNGVLIRNIYELANTIKAMNADVFKYHVNEQKNDFANWVEEVLDDKKLGKKMRTTIDKDLLVAMVKKRIKEVERLKPGVAQKVQTIA
ncbi:MAG: hypothetical protein V1743_06940 [Nanoarchaeota archaeon]